jgi:hypothetical protein
MPRASFAYRITAAQVGLSRDPDWIAAPAPVRAEVLRWLVVYGLMEKDKDLSEGLDKDGNPMVPISAETRKYRESAQGPADPNAPPLSPAYAVSRTRLLLDGRAVDSGGGYAEFFWRYDEHSGGSWGKILDYQRKGIGRSKVKRDVIGASLDMITRVRTRLLTRWLAFKRNGFKAPPTVPAPVVPPPRIVVIGRTDFEHFTYGIGGAGGAAPSRAALQRGQSTGFFQRKPGEGLPAFGGPGTLGPPKAPPAPKLIPPPATVSARAALDRAAEVARQAGFRTREIAPGEHGHGGSTIGRYDRPTDMILFNPTADYWAHQAREDELNRKANWFAGSGPDYLVTHEIGHGLHHRALAAELGSEGARLEWNRLVDLDNDADWAKIRPAIKKAVSRYAAIDGREFVAEIHAAVTVSGKTFPAWVLGLYRTLKGPPL